jgi:hypothetical protein
MSALSLLVSFGIAVHASEDCDRFDAIADLKDGVDVSADRVLKSTPKQDVAPLKDCLKALIMSVRNSTESLAAKGLDPAADIHAGELLDQLTASEATRSPASQSAFRLFTGGI